MVARAGAGLIPIPYKQLTAERLASAISEALRPEMTQRALNLGVKINEEHGIDAGTSSFYSHLPLARIGCSVIQDRPAVWKVAKSDIPLSAAAAGVLMREDLLSFDVLKLFVPSVSSIRTVPDVVSIDTDPAITIPATEQLIPFPPASIVAMEWSVDFSRALVTSPGGCIG